MSVTRRSFLLKTAGATTGLMIGFRLDCANVNEPTKVFSPNAFIEISVNDEVRLWATRSEMGQGVRTLLPMVLADELGADWNRIIVGQASPGGKVHPAFVCEPAEAEAQWAPGIHCGLRCSGS